MQFIVFHWIANNAQTQILSIFDLHRLLQTSQTVWKAGTKCWPSCMALPSILGDGKPILGGGFTRKISWMVLFEFSSLRLSISVMFATKNSSLMMSFAAPRVNFWYLRYFYQLLFQQRKVQWLNRFQLISTICTKKLVYFVRNAYGCTG